MAVGDSIENRDGDSVIVRLTSSVTKGQVAYIEGWLGVAAGTGNSGDYIAVEIMRHDYQFTVPSTLTVNKGDIVYVDVTVVTGHIPGSAAYFTASGSNRIRLFKATSNKNANNIVTGILLTGAYLS